MGGNISLREHLLRVFGRLHPPFLLGFLVRIFNLKTWIRKGRRSCRVPPLEREVSLSVSK